MEAEKLWQGESRSHREGYLAGFEEAKRMAIQVLDDVDSPHEDAVYIRELLKKIGDR